MKHLSVINAVCKLLKTNEVYLVGGSVRDILLGKEPKDYDFCTPLLPDEIETKIKNAGRRVYGIGKKFGTVGCKVEIDGQFQLVEITTFRKEDYGDTRKPTVEFIGNLREDLERRDFTINALAMDYTGKVYDYFNGEEDLKNKIIKCVGFPKHRFQEDPLRILRAIRFATTLNFAIEEKTLKKATSMKFDLLRISKERWVMELDKILMSKKPSIGLDILQNSQIMRVILPEISLQYKYNQNSTHHDFDLWEHTKRVVDSTPQELNLRWSALLHDVAKPFVRTKNNKGYSNYINHELLGAEISLKISDYLKFSKERKDYIYSVIKDHLKDESPLRIYDNMSKKDAK